MSHRWFRTVTLFALTAVTGCIQAQHPYMFSMGSTADAPVVAVARVLAANGQDPVSVDERIGIVQTQWQDTGFTVGFINQREAVLVRRYTVTVAPNATGNEVSLRADLQRCVRGDFIIRDTGVRGHCEGMDGVPESFQKDVDSLGMRLQQSLASAR